MIEKTKLTLFTWVNSLCMPIFTVDRRYGEKKKVLIIYKMLLIQQDLLC